jgi:pimeloyl-ACP methyl ester carboxylesterase
VSETLRRVVMVPGLGLDERSSARVRAGVPADVVLLPGMGLAEQVPTLDALAAGLLAQLGDGPVVLVGHSQSCQVVAAAAVDPRVAAVVLLGPTTDPRMRPVAVLAWRWIRTVAGEPWWQAPSVIAQWWRTGPRAMLALWRAAAPDRVDRRLARVTVPVTVVRGARDRLCPHDWAAQVCAAAPRGRLVEIPAAAHMTVHTHPDAVAAILREVSGAPRSD